MERDEGNKNLSKGRLIEMIDESDLFSFVSDQIILDNTMFSPQEHGEEICFNKESGFKQTALKANINLVVCQSSAT